MKQLVHLLKNAKLDLGADKEPPGEFQIFPFGEFETTKGTFLFDAESAKAVMACYKDRGVDMGGDYEHASMQDTPPAAGAPSPLWCQLEVRADGLWAVNVKWTPRATEYLKAGEYRYFSPAFYAPGDEKRIVELVNIALTNDPATKNQQPLVAATARDLRSKPVTLSMSFDQVREALCQALRSKYVDAYAYCCDVYDDSVVFSLGTKLLQAPYLVEGNVAVIGDPIEVQRTYTPVATSAGEETNMKTLLKMLALAETANETEAVVALTNERKAREDAQSELMKLTGAKTQGEAVGTIAAWKASHEQVEKLSTKLAEIEGAAKLAEVGQLVADGSRDGKIPPAMKEFWLEQGKKDVTALKTFLEKAPKLVTTNDAGRKPSTEEGELVTLDATDKEIAKKMGIAEKDFLEGKKRQHAKATAQPA